LPPLSPDLGATIQAELPDFVNASKPLDLTAQAITHPEMYKRTIKPLPADDAYGSLLLAVIIGEASDFAVAKGKACLEPLMGSPKPAVLGLLGDEVNVPASIISDARAAGIPFYCSPERALRALARLTAYGRSLKRAVTRQAVPPISAPPLTGQRTLTEYASKSYLAKLGIQIPRGVLAGNLLDASEAAAAIGFPVALKLQARRCRIRATPAPCCLVSTMRRSSRRPGRSCSRSGRDVPISPSTAFLSRPWPRAGLK